MSLSELLSESCNYYMCFKKNGNFHPSICYSYTCCFSFLQIAIKCQNSYVFHLIEMPSPQRIPIASVKIFNLVVLNLSSSAAPDQTPSLQPGATSTWTAAASCQRHQKHAAGNGEEPPGFNSGLGTPAAQIETVMLSGQSKSVLVSLTMHLSSEKSASKLSASSCFSLEGLFHA